MFFYLSKFAWFIISPGNLFLVALIVGVVLLWTRFKKTSRWLLTIVCVSAIIISVAPIGQIVVAAFENRFQKPQTKIESIDGIIVLGGIISPALSKSRGELSFGSASERLFSFIDLAKKYPEAKLVFTGGSGDPFNPDLSEAHIIRPLLAKMGVNIERIIFEDKSRNTVENATFTFDMLKPKENERWLLVTSAFHMPRAIGCFRKAGWKPVPYPVDYGTMANTDVPLLQANFILGLGYLNSAAHEALGLLVYFLTNKTDALFPAPSK